MRNLDVAGRSPGHSVTEVFEETKARQAVSLGERGANALLDALPDAIGRYDRELRCTYVNRAFARISGFAPEAHLGKAVGELGGPARIVKPLRAALQKVFATGEHQRFEFELTTPMGDRWFSIEVVPEHGGDGRIQAALTITRDVTDIMRANRELEQQGRALIERVKEMRCLSVVSTLLSLGDGGLPELLQAVVDAIPDGMQHPEVCGARLALGDLQVRTARYEPSDGGLRVPIELDGEQRGELEVAYCVTPQSPAFLDEERELIRTIAERVAETERRIRVEQELARSEAYFRSLSESVSDVVVITDADGNLKYVSPSVQSVLGYQPAELVGVDLFSLIHPEDRHAVLASIARALEDPSATPRLVHRFLHRDGKYRYLESEEQNLVQDPLLQGLVITSRDVTERRHLEEQLRQMQKMEIVGRLAGGIAHDFNNLLTVIESSAEFVSDVLTPGGPGFEEVDEIRKASRQAAALTRRLLAFSRREIVAPRRLELNRLIDDLEKMLRRLIGEAIELSTELEALDGRLLVDPGQIEQIVLNLAVNARDAMPTGGKLVIRTSSVTFSDSRRIGDTVLEAGSYIVLSVRDTGTGIDEEARAHMFEPFFTTKPHGTGLGLATVHGIVRQNRGAIDVQSTPGKGTEFGVYLPDEGHSLSLLPSQHPAPSPAGSETLLLVEDDAAVRTSARRALQNSGYHVLEACNGAEALTEAAAHHGAIALLITDIVMPHLNGQELAQQLCLVRPGLKVLFISGYTEDVLGGYGSRRADHQLLTKPFTPADLARKVREVLDR